MDLEVFRALMTDEGRRLLACLQAGGPAGEAAAAQALRGGHPAALVSAAREQVRLRRRAAAKYGEYAARLYFTPDSVELSSHLTVSEYKLDRVLHELGVVLIDAMCLGSGADALVLGWSHHTDAVDADPLTVEIAKANRPGMHEPMLYPRCEDVREFDSQGEAVFIDLMRPDGPDRLDRTSDPEAYDPPLSWALDRVRTTGYGWVRLAPGIADRVPPGTLAGADEVEWISHEGRIQEAVVWFGLDARRAPAQLPVRRATVLPSGASLLGRRDLPAPDVRPFGRYVYVPDPAVVHARLVGELARHIGGGLLEAGGCLVTSDELHRTPFASAYEVRNVLPLDGTRVPPG
ncbi:SAM-dependent methyltransferase [Streptomyces erythrochromogenes]|uniref:SAM-dependent methyltransferase n=1 Tax=Streptomyces erythrochromogenes TaxID=285574 RepID=UPI00341FE010